MGNEKYKFWGIYNLKLWAMRYLFLILSVLFSFSSPVKSQGLFQQLLADGGEILYIVPSETIIVQQGTAFGSIALPSTISVAKVNNVMETAGVVWSPSGYDGNTPGFYVLEGAPTGYKNPYNVKATIEVVVSHLTNDAVYYDFNKLTESDEAVISTVTDQCGNFNATGVGSPQCNVVFDNNSAYTGIKTFRDEGLKGLNMGTSGDNAFADQNFIEIYFVVNLVDGQQANGIQIFSGRTSDTNVTFGAFLSSTGTLTVTWGYTANRFTYDVSNYFANGEVRLYFGRIVLDFTNDLVEVYRNQRLLSGSYSLSTIVGKNPASYNNTANLYVGLSNQNGTSAGDNISPSYFHKFAITNTVRTKANAFEVEKEFIKGIYKSWMNEFKTSPGNVTAKRNAFINHIFNGNGLPTSTNYEDRDLTYGNANMHEVSVAGLTNANTSNIVMLRHDMTDNLGNVWRNFSYFIPNSGTRNGKLFIDHKGHGSEGGATHLALINDIMAEGYDVYLVAMPKGDNTNTDNSVVGDPYIRGHEDLYNEGLDDGIGPYSPLHLFYEASIRGLNHILANPGTYGSFSDIYAVGLSGGGQSVVQWGAMDTRITRTYCDRGIAPSSWKQYPFTGSTVNNDYEQWQANGFNTNNGPRNYAFYAENTVMDAILLCTTGGRRFFHLSHTEDPTTVMGGYGNLAWTHAMQKKAIEMGGTYGVFLNTVDNEEAHLYQPAERAAIIADLP